MAGLMRCAMMLSMAVLGSGGGVAWASSEWSGVVPGVAPGAVSRGALCADYLPEGMPRGEVVLRVAELDMRFDAAFADVAPPVHCLEPELEPEPGSGPDGRGEYRSPSQPQEISPPYFRPGAGHAQQAHDARPARPTVSPTVRRHSDRPADRHSVRRSDRRPVKLSPAHGPHRFHRADAARHAPAVTSRRNGDRGTAARSAEAGGGRTRGARAVHVQESVRRSTEERGRETGGIAARPPRAGGGDAAAGPVGLTEMANRRAARERRGVLDDLPLTSLVVLGLLMVLIVQMRLYLKRSQEY